MNNKQKTFLFRFAYCAVIVLIFAGIGGCSRSCAKKMEKDRLRYEREKDRKAREAEDRLRHFKSNNSIVLYPRLIQ